MNPNKRQCCGGPTISGGQYRVDTGFEYGAGGELKLPPVTGATDKTFLKIDADNVVTAAEPINRTGPPGDPGAIAVFDDDGNTLQDSGVIVTLDDISSQQIRDLGNTSFGWRDLHIDGSVISNGVKLPYNPPDQLRQPVLTSDTGNPNFLVEASSQYDPAAYAYRAFDNNAYTAWSSVENSYALDGTPGTTPDNFLGEPGSWVKITLKEAKFISNLYYMNSQIESPVKDYDVYVSMNGFDWSIIHTGVGLNNEKVVNTVTLDKPSYAKFIVLHIRTLHNSVDLAVVISLISFGATDVYTPALFSNTLHNNFVVSVSSESSASNTGWKAVNGSVLLADRWVSALNTYGVNTDPELPSLVSVGGAFVQSLGGVGGEWHKTSFNQPTYVDSYRLQWATDNAALPATWTILVSNDNITWLEAGTGARTPLSGSLDTGFFNLAKPSICKFIAIVITSNGGNSNIFINGITYSAKNELYVPGGLTFMQPRCGLYWEGNTNATTILAANFPYKVQAGTVVANHNVLFTTPTGSSSWFATYNGASPKVMHCGCTITASFQTAGQYEFILCTNAGTPIPGSSIIFDVVNAVDLYSTAIHAFIEMTNGQSVDLRVRTTSTPPKTLTVRNCNLFLVAMGAAP